MNTAIPCGETYLGKYRAERLLGEGGMGRVFLGRSLATGAAVVIKIMHEHRAQVPRNRAAFQCELEVMKRFRHPFAVALLDGSLEDPPCLVMEYVHGITLEEWLVQNGRLDVDEVGRVLGQLCQVLHAAHAGGILHRDLKTDNVMVVAPEEGDSDWKHIKVMDFGLARPGTGSFFLPMEKLTGDTESIGGGTPDYLCPEQIRGEEVDQRGDIYSVGVMLFKLLTGRLPFAEAETTPDILLAHLDRQPPRFFEMGLYSASAAIETVVRDCLAKEPHNRPQNVRELAERFGKALGRPVVDEADFVLPANTEPADPHPGVSAGLELDRFEAWMPEQVAVMKLRGFVDGVGGQIVDSVPGLIRVRLRDPRTKPQPAPTGLLAFFGLGRRRVEDPGLLIDLLMEKRQVGQRSLVAITVILPETTFQGVDDETMRRGFGQRICRELRAYLMIGR